MASAAEAAKGLNVLPSTPCRENKGRNTTITTITAAMSGAMTSVEDRATIVRVSWPASVSRKPRSTFSVITIAPSTIIPMAIATPPKDIRLAPIPKMCMAIKAKPTEKGMDNTTTKLGRQPPRKIKTTIATNKAPCHKAVVTVAEALFTRLPWS